MRAVSLSFFAVSLSLGASDAMAFDKFIPLGFGYSTTKVDPSHLTARERDAMSRADIYETDIYQRQLSNKQIDSRIQRFLNDRNADSTDYSVNY